MIDEGNYSSGQGNPLIDEIANWLSDQALGKVDLEVLSQQFFDRLYGAGMPISRSHITFDTLHPLFAAVSMEWNRGQGIYTNYHPHVTAKNNDAWKNSPFFTMLEANMTILRRHITGDEALLDFPVLKEFKEKGATDYLAYMIKFGDAQGDGGIFGSWLTDRPNGFTNSEIRSLLRLQKRLGVAYKIGIKEQISENIVTAYLGSNAGKRVLSGNIQRGDGEDIHAVIWFCDLRGSVKLANSMPNDEFLVLLNDFLEGMAGAVLDNGGEVLRYIGDAALAIFPIECENREGCQAAQACELALAAARDATSRINELNRNRQKNGETAVGYGIGLHIGNVMYGNIGSPERIEFTVIGPAANMAARIESQCKVLKKSILISSDFADNFEGELQSVGHHKLGGIDQQQELFTLI